ncbi:MULTISPECIES: type II toxin-antitoxin system PemK/MazF family toxin [unclassified Lysinibacillus]|uniref:type II toxin-antitoxin system PemK/MazF family toxin n=1 Tax=unclassified Lysinibacillus TaxID=2636778 RepID=UPI0025523E26|nr:MULTISPECIES: type II toxin-antitoxin system PemK/MazF family toxin [unclassified Lysinibacillus]MDM5248361.1 type II toxin-antitoxin system PemK/MazF family toxin [Lysinibacillus sp. G4S2]
MKVGDIYKIDFPFEQGQGSKYRPVLVFILITENSEFIALKIMSTPRSFNRVKIDNWKEANLSNESYVQLDNFKRVKFNKSSNYVGTLNFDDYNKIVSEFNKFHEHVTVQK